MSKPKVLEPFLRAGVEVPGTLPDLEDFELTPRGRFLVAEFGFDPHGRDAAKTCVFLLVALDHLFGTANEMTDEEFAELGIPADEIPARVVLGPEAGLAALRELRDKGLISFESWGLTIRHPETKEPIGALPFEKVLEDWRAGGEDRDAS